MHINSSPVIAMFPHPLKTFSDKPELTRMLNELDAEQFDLFCEALRQRSTRSARVRDFDKTWTNGEISFDSPAQRSDS